VTVLLYDSDQPQAIPAGVWAAGYCDGYAASAWAQYWSKFPGARRIAVFLGTTVTDGDSFDVESGDMTPAEAPAAVANAHKRGVAVPWVYCNRSNRPAVENALIMAGILSDQVALWVATLDGTQTVPPGPYPVAAVQYLNSAHSGGHYDISIVNAVFGPGGGTIGGDMFEDADRQLLNLVNQGVQTLIKPYGDNIIALLNEIKAAQTSGGGLTATQAQQLQEIHDKVMKDLA
jgi:hypothetical protein